MDEFVLGGRAVDQRLQCEAHAVGDEGTQVNVQTVLVMLLVVVVMAGMRQVLPGVVVGHGMAIGMFIIGNMCTLGHSEQQGVIE